MTAWASFFSEGLGWGWRGAEAIRDRRGFPAPLKTPKSMDPILPILSIVGYWAIVLATLEVQVLLGLGTAGGNRISTNAVKIIFRQPKPSLDPRRQVKTSGSFVETSTCNPKLQNIH